ncbi:ABC transporter ATP-binding protein/permease [Bacteroidales bacterium OttesenSCG-928-M11]|nr:ABC transporter ATP-binding protein/permease [Bacteroidales bacterium OttesenSCG-928-M11]
MVKGANIAGKIRPGGHRSPLVPVTEVSRDFKGTVLKLLRFMKPFYKKLFFVVIFAIASTLFGIFGPVILGKAVDILFDGTLNTIGGHIPQGINFAELIKVLSLLLIIYFLSSLFSYVQEYMMSSISQRIIQKMRNDVNDKLHKLPLNFYDTKTHGEILSRVTNDIDTIAGTLQQNLIQVITAAITLIGIAAMMFIINPWMSLITFVVLPLSFGITKFIASRSQKYFTGQAQELGNLNGHTEEMFGGHGVVKAFNYEKESERIFEKTNNKLYSYGWKAQFVTSVIFPLLNFMSNITYVVICVLGGYLTATGKITLGSVQSFIMYSRQFNQPIQQVSQIVNVLQAAVAAAERVFEVLEEKEQISDPTKPVLIDEPRGEVVFEHVSFRYTPNKPLIEDISIRVKPGELVAIVGPTGAGKTTLVNLLMRFYEVNKGTISIDGVDIRTMSRKSLHSHIGMVLQDTWLFKGSIRENIAFGKRGATDEEVYRAAKLAMADSFIRTLPQGYNTEINEEGSNLSAGQKQLITIARALIVEPSIMILDEATSSVDTRTEALIQNSMKRIMQGHTSFVIAHRLSTIREADNILVMHDGNIIEQGNHDTLIAQKGFYYELYCSQFGNYQQTCN